MRLAVIDMGTNTFNLIIAEYDNKSFKVVCSAKQPVKLGQKIADNHFIDSTAINRIMQTMCLYYDEIKKYNVSKTVAVATSSIRTAKNQKEILQLIKEKLNIDIQVIDGEREAELIYIANEYAIREYIKNNPYPFLVTDIGGGSTEFIIAKEKNILWKKSFLLGMARLLDEIKPSDPIQPEDIQKIHRYADAILSPLNEKIQFYQPSTLVGSSGVFDSIVEMIEANIRPINKTESYCIIDKTDFYTIYHQLLPLSYEERLQFKGLIKMRADMIVISFILIDYILTKYNIQNFIISFYSLKEGIIIEQLKQYQRSNP